MLEKFIEQYIGKVVNFDGSPESGGQSPQLVAQWCSYLGLPYQWANAYDWWDDSDETFAEHWDKTYRAQASNELPRPGDIVVFSSALPGSEDCGHLSVFIEAKENTSEWIGFDANWGGRSAHLQSHNWAYVVGWFSPANRAVLEAPIPTPIAVPTISAPFDSQLSDAQIMTIKTDQTPLYNLNDIAWDSFNANPLNYANAGHEFTVAAIAKHRLGGTFYMPDPDRAEGYAVEDCQEYGTTDESPETNDEEPLEPSLPFKGLGIAPPVMAPSKSDTVQTLKPIPRYRMVREALEGVNSTGELQPNKYYVYKRMPNGIINVTLNIGQSGYWINPEDLEPKKKLDWHVLEEFPDGPRYFKAVGSSAIVDQDNLAPDLNIMERQPILIAGYFRGPDNEIYWAPDVTINGPTRQWYGVAKDLLKPLGVVVSAPVAAEQPLALPFYAKMNLSLQNSLVLKRLKEKYIRR